MALTKNTQHTLTNCVILCLYWPFHLGLESFTFSWRETFRRNIDLELERVVYASVVYSISFTWLLCFKSLGVVFSCRIYCVTVKTIHLQGVKTMKK